MDDHLQSLQSSALTATRHAATLPTDLPFYRAVDPRVSQQIDSISSRVLHLTHQLLQLSSSLNPNLPVRPQETLQDPDCLMFHFHSSVVDVMDHLFERTVSSPSSVETHTHTSFAFQKDSCLDQALGRNKAPTITINKDSAPNPRVSVLILGGFMFDRIHQKTIISNVVYHAPHLKKPQLSFTRKPDNSDTPWYPCLTHKYNAKVPLGYLDADDESFA